MSTRRPSAPAASTARPLSVSTWHGDVRASFSDAGEVGGGRRRTRKREGTLSVEEPGDLLLLEDRAAPRRAGRAGQGGRGAMEEQGWEGGGVYL